MSVNRLADLQRGSQANTSPTPGYEMRPLLSSDVNSLQGFLNEVSQIKDHLNQLNQNVNRSKSLQSSMLQTADAAELGRYRQQLDDLTHQSQNLMVQVKQKLKEIEPHGRQSDLAMRQNTFRTVTRSFMDAIENNRRVSADFQKAEAQQLERQIRIANPNATPQEIEEAVAGAEQGRNAVFAQQLMQSVGGDYRRQNAQNALDAVQERHQDIHRLAKSVQELSELFLEMQEMLEAQSKVIEVIETTAYDVAVQLEQGNAHVEKAIVTAKSTRRKKWICFGIFLVIIIIIAIILAIQIPKSKNQ